MIVLLENNPNSLQSNSAAVSRRFSDGNVPLAGHRNARPAKPRPTIEELREYLDYDPETGVLTWKNPPTQKIRQGQAAGTKGTHGYQQVQVKGVLLLAHRVAFALYHGRWPSPFCDHVNGDKADNRIANLRECSASENQHNQRIRRDSPTGVKGVVPHRNAYRTQVRINGVLYRKCFRRLEDAVAYVKQLREQLHGDFARHE